MCKKHSCDADFDISLEELQKYDSTFTSESVAKHSVKLNRFNNSKLKLEKFVSISQLEKVIDKKFITPQIREALSNHMQYMFYANMFKSKVLRTAIERLPTNEQYAEYKTTQILNKSYGHVSDTVKNELINNYESPYDFDGMLNLAPSYLPLFIDTLNLNNNYYEMLVYSYMKEEFSRIQREYWQDYIKLFASLHKNFKDEFSLSVQFRSNLKFDELKQLKTQILKYQKRISKDHKSPIFKEYMDAFDIKI